MILRRVHRLALLALPGAAVALAPMATAEPQLRVPDIRFEVTGPGVVTAWIQNPNDRGYCWAADADTGAIFGGDRRPDSYARPGESIAVSLSGLPSGKIRAHGKCGFDYPSRGSHDYTSTTQPVEIDVVGGKPRTGSFGS